MTIHIHCCADVSHHCQYIVWFQQLLKKPHTHTHTHTYKHRHTYTNTDTQTHTHKHKHTKTHTQTQTKNTRNTQTHEHTQTRTNTRTRNTAVKRRHLTAQVSVRSHARSSGTYGGHSGTVRFSLQVARFPLSASFRQTLSSHILTTSNMKSQRQRRYITINNDIHRTLGTLSGKQVTRPVTQFGQKYSSLNILGSCKFFSVLNY